MLTALSLAAIEGICANVFMSKHQCAGPTASEGEQINLDSLGDISADPGKPASEQTVSKGAFKVSSAMLPTAC